MYFYLNIVKKKYSKIKMKFINKITNNKQQIINYPLKIRAINSYFIM